jgi:hypothetical protein
MGEEIDVGLLASTPSGRSRVQDAYWRFVEQ